jgi:pimeloyl-ACP methyl ester carboxylesterase
MVCRLGVYAKWFKLDPWFALRMWFRDFWHVRSPLSSTTLVHRAFFSPEFPRERVREMERWMPEYESLTWPIGMMLPFVNVRNVLMNILGWGQGRQRLLVVSGEKDTLMGVTLMRRMAVQYRRSFVKNARRLLSSEGKETEIEEPSEPEDHEGVESSVDGVRFVVIKGSGHHLQNDLPWEDCASQVLNFLEHL